MQELSEKRTENRYGYRVLWSPEDKAYVGTCDEFPSLSHVDDAAVAALDGIRMLVATVVQDLVVNKKAVPKPLSR
jgi:hypothetical protein